MKAMSLIGGVIYATVYAWSFAQHGANPALAGTVAGIIGCAVFWALNTYPPRSKA